MTHIVAMLFTNGSGITTLLYSTYLGGDDSDIGYAIAVDGAGNAYVTGSSRSTDFPTRNLYQPDMPGEDAFVTKLNPNSVGFASLLYSTYLGGDESDKGSGIAVDGSGNAYVTGTTDSTNFPIWNAFQADQLANDAFVTKLNTNGSGNGSLLYSTYLGGSASDRGSDIAVDSAGNAYVTGTTGSNNFPTTSNAYKVGNQVGLHAFISRLADPTNALFGNQLQTHKSGTVSSAELNANATENVSLVYSSYVGDEAEPTPTPTPQTRLLNQHQLLRRHLSRRRLPTPTPDDPTIRHGAQLKTDATFRCDGGTSSPRIRITNRGSTTANNVIARRAGYSTRFEPGGICRSTMTRLPRTVRRARRELWPQQPCR